MHIPKDFVKSYSWPDILDERKAVLSMAAVYALIHENDFGRLDGKSNILYIGSTKQLGGDSQSCRLRIYRYPNGGHAKELRRKTAVLTDVGVNVTLTWKYMSSEEAARAEEARLLTQYEKDHGELPPFNLSTPHVPI